MAEFLWKTFRKGLLTIFGIILGGIFWFAVDTKKTEATVQVHEGRILTLEKATYRNEGRLDEILKAVKRSDDSQIEKMRGILKEVRQLRQTNKE